MRRSAEAWERAWVWLSQLPRSVYRSTNSIVDLVSMLCRQAYVHWCHEVVRAWVAVLGRAEVECPARTSLRHAVVALQYSYRRTTLPLGAVVHKAFPRAYEVSLERNEFED